mgnify:FL=1
MKSEPNPVSKYIITNSTYCLISRAFRNHVHTLILDKHGQVTVSFQPLRVIRHTCSLHGTTYEAAKHHAKNFFGHTRHKMPIMVAYNFGEPCVMFPLFSPQSKQNIWVAVNAIINIEERNESTVVTFLDGSEQVFPVHLKSFNQQYVRAVIYTKNIVIQRNNSI